MNKNNKFIAKNKKHLIQLIEKEIQLHGNNCDLNFIDTIQVTDMSYIFSNLIFNGNISNWNTKNVTDMRCMFYKSDFNGDISLWDISSVLDMKSMFYDSQFNRDISNWNVEKVGCMITMFYKSQFAGDLSNWKPYSLKNSESIFFPNEVPYWAEKDNNQTICEAINNYIEKKSLKDKLENKLLIKNNTTRKNKI